MTSSDLRLRRLNLTGNDVSSVAPDLLARAVTRLHQGRLSK